MKITFLGADVPLSKKFTEIAPGQYKEESYPHAACFNSINRSVDSLREYSDTIIAAAGEGLCLLKGNVTRDLHGESRAGSTDAAEATEWICLDVDYPVIGKDPAVFLHSLSDVFRGASFLFQYSSGHRIKDNEGWRGHFFLMLDAPESPQALKAWLLHLNLHTPLQEHVGLSASGGALTYPLDITTCQNDKLLYIAPPTCVGFEDPVEERFHLHVGDTERLKLDLSGIRAAANEESKKRKIMDLRKRADLPVKTIKTTQVQGWEVMTNPDPVTVTSKKEERGFVYLNLNGGDSWGYFFPKDKPDILFNFKGEPALRMKDVDREIYNEYRRSVEVDQATSADPRPFGFLWPEDDQYYRGFAVPETKEILWLKPTGSKAKLKDFYVQNGIEPGRGWAVDEWQLKFDPSIEGYADFGKKEVNTYRQTTFMKEATHTTSGVPATIDRVLSSVCVEEDIKRYFLNWLAYIFQTRKKTNTAWIFQGVQGTGKGVLFTYILSPLMGRQYCHEMTMDRLDDDFNAYLAENLILFIDEANIGDSRNGERLLNRIKNLITEPELHIRAMRTNAVLRDNYSNVILASNYDEIIPLEPTDRRFNVAPRQETPITLEYEDIVQIGRELPGFANFLHSYTVEHSKIHRILITDARQRLIDVSKTTVDNFFHAIRDGNLSYFTQYLDPAVKSDSDGLRYHDFALAVTRWVDHVGKECNIPRNELRACYQYLQGTTIAATKFNRMCRKYNIEAVPIRTDGQVTRGLSAQLWKLPEEELEAIKETENSNVIHLAKKVD